LNIIELVLINKVVFCLFLAIVFLLSQFGEGMLSITYAFIGHPRWRLTSLLHQSVVSGHISLLGLNFRVFVLFQTLPLSLDQVHHLCPIFSLYCNFFLPSLAQLLDLLVEFCPIGLFLLSFPQPIILKR